MRTTSELFSNAFASTATKIAFQEEWKNGTGYLDKLVQTNVGLRAGECATMVDDFKRRVLLLGSPVGNIVLFERYSPELVLNTKISNFEVKRSSVIVGNYPSAIENMFGGMGGIGSNLQPEGFERLFHSNTWNIGRDLEELTRQFARAAQPKVKLQQVEVETMLQPADVTMENIHEIVKFSNPSVAAIADRHPVLKGVLYLQAGMAQYTRSIVAQAEAVEKRYGEEMKALADAGDYQTLATRVIEITCDDLNNTLEYAKEFTGIVTPLGKATSHIVLRGIKRNAGKLGTLVGTCVKFGMEVKAEVNAVKAEIATLKEGFMPSDSDSAVKH